MRKNIRRILSVFSVGILLINLYPVRILAFGDADFSVPNPIFKRATVLGPIRFPKLLRGKAASMYEIDVYAEKLYNYADTDMSGINSINTVSQTTIEMHQKTAKQNAEYWKRCLKPDMLQIDQNIINFNDVFQQTYNNIFSDIEEKNIDGITVKLKQLYEEIKLNKHNIDRLIERIEKFKSELNHNNIDIHKDLQILQPILNTTNINISRIQKEIAYWNDEIRRKGSQLHQGESLCLTVIGCVVGGPLIIEAKIAILDAENKIGYLMENVYGLEQVALIITDFQKKISNMESSIDNVISVLQSFSSQWMIIQEKCDSIIHDVQNMVPESFSLLQLDLEVAHKEWMDIVGFVRELQEIYESNS